MTKSKTYRNWNEYFKEKLEGSGKYECMKEGIHGDTIMEEYVSSDKNDKTVIKVGYLNQKLIYWKFENPLTKGFNKYQDNEYFYRYDFTPEESYGDPGLEFIDININAINKQLNEGLRGKEVQYFKNGELIKSQIFFYYHGQKEAIPHTIYFQNRSLGRKILDLFIKENDKSIQTNEIDLHKIFKGI